MSPRFEDKACLIIDTGAGAMLYLACDESSFVTGTMLTVDGGMTAR